MPKCILKWHQYCVLGSTTLYLNACRYVYMVVGMCISLRVELQKKVVQDLWCFCLFTLSIFALDVGDALSRASPNSDSLAVASFASLFDALPKPCTYTFRNNVVVVITQSIHGSPWSTLFVNPHWLFKWVLSCILRVLPNLYISHLVQLWPGFCCAFFAIPHTSSAGCLLRLKWMQLHGGVAVPQM